VGKRELIAFFIDLKMPKFSWYDVSYEYGKPLLWGRQLGCDFVKTSCKQWIDSKLEKFVHEK